MKPLLLLLTLVISGISLGQEFDYHTDYKSLLEQTQDSTSSNFYPKLLERFNRNDSTMTNMEVLTLQIGFTVNTNYKPYKTIETEREIMKLIGQKSYKKAISACNGLLESNPINFTALMEKGFAYMKLKKDSTEFHKEKFMKVVYAIMASGNGSKERPHFVLSPLDGQTLSTHILGGSLGTMGSGRDENGYFLDILEVYIEGKTLETKYFHINHASETMFKE